MKAIVFSLLLVSTWVSACDITLPHRLVILGKSGNLGNAVQSAQCESKTIEDLGQMLEEVEGRISAEQIISMMESKGHSALTINPHMVQVQQLKNIIREQLLLPPGLQVKSTSGMNTSDLLALAAGDRLDVRCQQCLYGSQQVINVTIQGFDGSMREFLATADFKKMVRAYRLLGSIAAFSSITEADVKEEFTEAVPHTDLITDISALKFYKSNKPIKNGELLRFSDLNAVNLVRAGLKTDVILENSMIRIKTQGISRANGAIGDTVEVYHPQKNKKYQGKVVDNNKVLVEI